MPQGPKQISEPVQHEAVELARLPAKPHVAFTRMTSPHDRAAYLAHLKPPRPDMGQIDLTPPPPRARRGSAAAVVLVGAGFVLAVMLMIALRGGQ